MNIKKILATMVIAAFAVGSANAAIMHVHDQNGVLGTVDTVTGDVSVIGSLGVVLTDIAFDSSGNLFGLSFDQFYSIDPTTAETTLIGSHSVAAGNALVFGTDGTLYAAGFSNSELHTIDVNTGMSTSLGSTGFDSGGDLAFVNGALYLATRTNQLAQLDLADLGSSSLVGGFGVGSVFGIASPGDGTLFGVGGTSIFEVDLATGMAINAVGFGGQGLVGAFGQSFFGEAVIVPVPAALPLFMSALAVGGALRRRRQTDAL